ncbi:MAG: hypothetical protein Q4B52_04380 [Tissierellia bacterium]|nr:hypothetical protein [Tissierellia bacterium]
MNKSENYKKIRAKIEKTDYKVLGISTPDKKKTSNISKKISDSLSQRHKVLFLDLDVDNDNKNDLENTLGFKFGSIVDLIDSYKLLEFINEKKEQYDYIIINERSAIFADSLFTSKFEDAKIIVVNENHTKKKDFMTLSQDIDDMNIPICGVIYNK